MADAFHRSGPYLLLLFALSDQMPNFPTVHVTTLTQTAIPFVVKNSKTFFFVSLITISQNFYNPGLLYTQVSRSVCAYE